MARGRLRGNGAGAVSGSSGRFRAVPVPECRRRLRAAPPEALGAGPSSRRALRSGAELAFPRFAGAAALLVLGLAALVFTGLGSAPLERAEIYFLDGARDMVETGRWLVPHFRGEPFFDTPESIKYAMIKALVDNKTRYAPSSGIDPLRAALAKSSRQKIKSKQQPTTSSSPPAALMPCM